MPKLAIIHTTPATIEPLKALANDVLPGVTVINFVDDSILPQLRDNGGNLNDVTDRLVQYAVFAQQVGANVILNACSSVGPVVDAMQANVSVPVVRMDDAMTARAVTLGERIGVAATLATTLDPTLKLLHAKASQANKNRSNPQTQFVPHLIDSAYEKLLAGNAQGHDEDLVQALTALAAQTDVVVLAQASMARVVSQLPAEQQDRFLTSPRLGMECVKAALNGTDY